ncbi:addiction module component [Algoriphagus sp. PAP.12]|uniref:addiction module component n=1 Tax=Algoriphagus sp. PAP.12 TaxID=2996678 RepID=UPI00227B81F5|nr:addiction module component [Algoriphagus sp. PAP.12]
MDVQSLKIDLIQWLIELQDQTVLQKLQVLKEQEEISAVHGEGQMKGLNDRKKNMKMEKWNFHLGKM